MKKNLVFLLFLFVINLYNTFAQDGDLKSYYNFENGFSGVAQAIFLGEDNPEAQGKIQEFLSTVLPEDVREVSKITKNNMWLLKQALNEWEYKKDEYYFATIAENKWATNGLIFIVKIKGKDDFEWKGYYLSEKVLKKMDKTLDE